MTTRDLPLAGIRVVDSTRNVAGPYATAILADLGAEIIKIEAMGTGDDSRQWGPPFWEEESAVYLALNRNKRSLALDLKRPESAEVMERLVRWADVFVESLRPGVMDRLGYGYAWASDRNPELIYTSVTPYGEDGPLRDRPGYDPLMQAFGGVMSVTGEPGHGPVRVGVSLIDQGTGMWTAIGVMSALMQRQRDGRGRRVTSALYETAIAWMGYHLVAYWVSGSTPQRHGSGNAMVVPYQAFRTRDQPIVIAAGNDSLFARLCSVLDREDLAVNARFARNQDRVANRVELVRELDGCTATWASGELMARLLDEGIPFSPIQDTSELAAEPQAIASGMFQTLRDGSDHELPSVGLPLRIDGVRPPLRRPPPRLGEHSRAALADVGFNDDEMRLLAELGVIPATEEDQ